MAKGTINVIISGNAELLRKELKSVSRSMHRTGRDLQQIGGSLFKAVGAPMLAIGAVSVNTAMRFERMEMGLRSVMGSSAAAAVELEKLRKVAQLPGVSLEQAIQGSTRLQAVGINADLARDAIQEFGNALAVSGGSAADMDGVILALTQMKGAGKILTQDLRQITSRIPMLASVMKKQFGTDVPEEINKMGISFEEFSAKIIAGMQSEIPRAANTLENSFVNLKAAGENLLSVIGNQLIEDTNLQEWVDGAIESIDNMAKSFSNMSPLIKGVIYSIAGLSTILGGGLWVGGKIAYSISMIADAASKLSPALVKARTAMISMSKATIAFLTNPAVLTGAAVIGGLVLAFEGLTKAMAMEGKIGDLARQMFTHNQVTQFLTTSYLKLKGAIFGAKEETKELAEETKQVEKEYTQTEETVSRFNELMGKFDAAIENSKKKEEERAKFLESTKKIYGDLREELQFLTAKQELYGGSLDAERVSSYQSAIDSLLKLGITPASKGVQDLYEKMIKLQDALSARTLKPLTPLKSKTKQSSLSGETDFSAIDISGLVPDIDPFENMGYNADEFASKFPGMISGIQEFGSVISSVAASGIDSFAKLGDAALFAAMKAAKGFLVEAAMAYLSTTAKLGPIGLALAGAGISIISGLMDSAISKAQSKKVPALAQGGMTTGPGMAMIGDNASGKEFVIPFERMGEFARQAMGGNNINVAGEFRVKGSDLILVLERANRQLVNRRGFGLNQ